MFWVVIGRQSFCDLLGDALCECQKLEVFCVSGKCDPIITRLQNSFVV